MKEPPPNPPAINSTLGKALLRCDDCDGYLLVSIDWHGNATVEAPVPDTLLGYFPEWFDVQARKRSTTPAMIAAAIGREYERHGASAAAHRAVGCPRCSVLHPYDPEPGTIITERSSKGWGILYQCPDCGTYRWRLYEVHGFAEIPAWGFLTRESLISFGEYLDEESARRSMPVDDLIVDIINHSL